MESTTHDDEGPRRVGAVRAPLVARERRLVGWAVITPVVVTAGVVSPLAATGSWTWGEVVWSAVVFGGLLALAAAFVVVDRLQALRCSGCGEVNISSARRCRACDYDLERDPRYACDERHLVFVDPGLCDCGRRLHLLDPPRGVGAQVRFTLKFGAWFLGFLLLSAVALSFA